MYSETDFKGMLSFSLGSWVVFFKWSRVHVFIYSRKGRLIDEWVWSFNPNWGW